MRRQQHAFHPDLRDVGSKKNKQRQGQDRKDPAAPPPNKRRNRAGNQRSGKCDGNDGFERQDMTSFFGVEVFAMVMPEVEVRETRDIWPRDRFGCSGL